MVKKKLPHLLVIGGTGFIGYHVILSARKKGWKVSSVSLHEPKKNRKIRGVNYLAVDISNLKNLEKKLIGKYSHILNLGGYVQHDIFKNRIDRTISTHLTGLVNLSKIFLNKKIKKFVQIGSSTEYGNIKAPQTEKLYDFSKSSYALAKLASTFFLIKLYNTYKFPVIILRLFQVYGPGQDKNRILPQVILGCLKNKTFPTSKGNQIRDFCYIDDVVKAIFLALNSKKNNGEVFNIGYGKPLKIKNIIQKIQKVIGKGKPQFGKFKYRKDENMNLYPNINKAKAKLKWKPKITFEKGIKIVINSLK